MKNFLLGCAGVLLGGCMGMPKGVKPVQSFDVDRYLGTWYEISRLDHRFERGLSEVSADYSFRKDGKIRVLNRGYDAAKKTWKQAEGKAVLAGTDDAGHLKVSFFGPFYGSYVIFDLDDAYQNAYVTSYNRSYLWFLSRTPTVTEAAKKRFVDTAAALGYATDELIWVEQMGRGGTMR